MKNQMKYVWTTVAVTAIIYGASRAFVGVTELLRFYSAKEELVKAESLSQALDNLSLALILWAVAVPLAIWVRPQHLKSNS